MKRLVLLCLAIILLAPAPSFAATLTIATFNCEFLTRPKVHMKFGLPFRMTDASPEQQREWEDMAFRDQKFQEAAQAVAQVIHSINADVITLTEVGNTTDVQALRAEVAALGGDYPHVAIGDSSDTTTRQNVAVFSKFPLSELLRRIPGREHYLEELDDPDSEDDTGVSKGLRATVTAYGQEFLIYTVHLASEAGGHEKDAQRIAQASIIRRHYLPEVKQGRLVIVTGDLNDRRGEPAIHRIRGLDDIHEDLIQTGQVNYFDDDKLGTRWTYEYRGERNQIDHILLSPAVKHATLRSGIHARTVDHGNALASDHRPFVLTLKLRD